MFYSKTLKISIGTIIKDQEMLRLVSDYLQTKKMCRHAVNTARETIFSFSKCSKKIVLPKNT